jgi:lysophospholipase L1-like esterase
MPLSPEIAALAPPGMWDLYQTQLHQAAAASGTALIDFFGDETFKSEIFKDGVHLNYEGTTILANKLNDILTTKHPDILAAMAKHAAQRNHGGS